MNICIKNIENANSYAFLYEISNLTISWNNIFLRCTFLEKTHQSLFQTLMLYGFFILYSLFQTLILYEKSSL